MKNYRIFFLDKFNKKIPEIFGNKVFYFRILFVVLGIFSALLLLEIYSRLTYVRYHVPFDCFKGDSVLNHVHEPNKTCPFVTGEWNVTYRINSFGFRDRERSLEKPANTYRILMLGDSTTEGWGVSQDKTFSALLEEKLNGLGKLHFEVINMGVTSYSPLLEYLQLKNIGLKFNPDLVILNFDYSDFADDRNYEAFAAFEGNNNPQSVRPQDPRSFGYRQTVYKVNQINAGNLYLLNPDNSTNTYLAFLEKYSILFRRFFATKDIMLGNNDILPEPASDSFVLPERNISLISNTLKSKNIPFILTVFPRKSHLFPSGNTAYFSTFQKFGEQNGIRVLNLLPLFKTQNPQGLYFKHDFHGTEKFHKLMVKGIYDYLVNNNLID